MCLKQSLEIEKIAGAVEDFEVQFLLVQKRNSLLITLASFDASKKNLEWLESQEMAEHNANNKKFVQDKILDEKAKICQLKNAILEIKPDYKFKEDLLQVSD